MSFETFLYINYISYFYDNRRHKPALEAFPLSYNMASFSQENTLTAYRHSLVNFGNYVFVNPVNLSLNGVRFEVDYFAKNPLLFLQMLSQKQKTSPLYFINADYNGFLFLNSWNVDKGKDDLHGIYNLTFTCYEIDFLSQNPANDVQFSQEVINVKEVGEFHHYLTK